MKHFQIVLGSFAILAALILNTTWADDDPEQLFVRRVLPLFTEKCLGCHGSDSSDLKGEFDIRSSETAHQGGASGLAAIVSGRATQSPLFLSVARDPQSNWSPMPPKDADGLTQQQIDWIKAWIDAGAPWPEDARAKEIAKSNADRWAKEDGSAVNTSGGMSSEWTDRKYKPGSLWGYQPVRVGAQFKTQSIDQFLQASMPAGLSLAPATDAQTFLRRATFDLTGLPPTPDEVLEFERAYSQDADVAIGKLIDRLLKSPHYGERMAQHWLDVTRYADSSGFSNDFERGNAWRYRDYVVRSFNSDKPFDQFILEQIAGDEIDPDDPEKIIATGFLRMGPWELTGMEVEKVARQRFLDDVVNSVGETFLAHSLQCARCHDHKFDPVPTRDYYSIQAVFATTQIAERPAPFLPQENIGSFDERRYLEMTGAQHEETLASLDVELVRNAEKWFTDNGKDPARWNQALEKARQANVGKKANNAKAKTYSDLFTATRKILTDAGEPESDFPPKLVGFTPAQFGMERVARKGLERLKWEFDRYEPFALAVYAGKTRQYKTVVSPLRMPENRLSQGELESTCILNGGDPFSEGPAVEPGVLSILSRVQEIPIPTEVEGRRRAFAEWIASPNNPLTTRAIANRIWMWHFDQPIAGNPNNFGSTGKKPTHPELLDWLAATFVDRGWSFKAMHRLIMTSAAYRRSASHPNAKQMRELDPLGNSYAVFKPRRLSAEELRDAMLSASGELNPTLGGIPMRPEINQEAALQPRQVMGTFAAAWVPNPKPHQRNRRSLYTLKLRGLTDPAMEVFNAPAPDFSCERRESSTITPQVFAFFNSQASRTRALALAARVLKETKSDQEAIHRCFALVFGRTETAEELDACLAHWQQLELLNAKSAPSNSKPPFEIRREAVEENTGEKFSFQEKLYSNADYVPDLQPADCDARTRALSDVCLVLLNSNEFAYVY